MRILLRWYDFVELSLSWSFRYTPTLCFVQAWHKEFGERIFDGSGGPSVACIGWGNQRVIDAVVRQITTAPYSATVFYTTKAAEDLGRFLVDSTHGHMARAYIVNSGW